MLILASGSQNRIQALTVAKIPFKSVPADIDEKSIRDENMREMVVKIARAKVETVAKSHSGVILGCDGVNVVDGQVLEKPVDRDDAIRMLKLQSGKESIFLTGYYLYNSDSGKTYQGTSECAYRFRDLSDAEIEKYVNSEPVYNWAAAFSPVNSSAITFLESVNGSLAQFCFSMPFEKLVPIFKLEGVLPNE